MKMCFFLVYFPSFILIISLRFVYVLESMRSNYLSSFFASSKLSFPTTAKLRSSFPLQISPPKSQNQKIDEGGVCFESRNLIVFFIKLIERCLLSFLYKKKKKILWKSIFTWILLLSLNLIITC
jgi:hypothetical protein